MYVNRAQMSAGTTCYGAVGPITDSGQKAAILSTAILTTALLLKHIIIPLISYANK